MIIVPAAGPTPCDVLLCGEAPGRTEAELLQPFVGKSGQEQDRLLSRHGLSVRKWRRTNVYPVYRDGNPDPSPADVAEWTPYLLAEISRCRPRLIIAVGRFAMRWFLGESAELDACHGLPHRPGAFDPTRTNRAPANCCILPIYHVAMGFHAKDDDKAFDPKALIAWDYARVAEIVELIRTGKTIRYREDEYAGKESYEDVTGKRLRQELADTRSNRKRLENLGWSPDIIGVDTEGYPDDRHSIQFSIGPGQGFVLRTCQPDFSEGMAAFQYWVDKGSTIVVHDANTPQGSGYETIMCRAMGGELSRACFFNTMYWGYLLRLEPIGLKPLAYRWCGMEMVPYESLVADKGLEKQIDYLTEVLNRSGSWPKPATRLKYNNNGTSKPYTPQSIERAVEKILADTLSGKVTKEGPTDPYKRWKKVDPESKRIVERELGRMPVGTLMDLPLADATRYAARDADAPLRLYFRALEVSPQFDIRQSLIDHGNRILPIVESMQAAGLPASKSHFDSLSSEMWDKMTEVGRRISVNFYEGRPFNPKSTKQVGILLRRLGLADRAMKRTAGGAISTDEKSIGHLRYTESSIADIFEWRQYQHIRDSFCKPIIRNIDAAPPSDWLTDDLVRIRCTHKPATTETRRPATEKPNYLAMPTRTAIGRKVRHGFKWPDDSSRVFGSWDLGKIEAAYMTHESQDPLLLDFFNRKQDIHKQTAILVLGADPDNVTKELRDASKTINYGIIYGMMGHALSIELKKLNIHWPEKKCEKAIADWYNTYAGVKRYKERTSKEVAADPIARVFDRWGMVRYLPDIWSTDYGAKSQAERYAVSHRIQGGAQGMIQNSILWLWPYIVDLQDSGYDVQLHLEIHDELLLSFEEDMWEVVDGLVIEALTQHHGVDDITVPVEADGHMARSWGSLKEA